MNYTLTASDQLMIYNLARRFARGDEDLRSTLYLKCVQSAAAHYRSDNPAHATLRTYAWNYLDLETSQQKLRRARHAARYTSCAPEELPERPHDAGAALRGLWETEELYLVLRARLSRRDGAIITALIEAEGNAAKAHAALVKAQVPVLSEKRFVDTTLPALRERVAKVLKEVAA